MKTRFLFAPLAVAMALTAGAAAAANLGNLSGQACPAGYTGTWHFVNNQTGGAASGFLTASFSSGTCSVGASKVLASSQHFYCVGYGGSLLGASTNLPGKLVLSDFSCVQDKVCDPKVEKCE